MRPRPALLGFLLACAGGLASLAAGETPATAPGSAAPAPAAKPIANVTNRFEIRGMHCEGCAKGITGEVRVVPGVATVEVSLSRKLAVVAYDTNRVSQTQLVRVIREAGYEALPLRERRGIWR